MNGLQEINFEDTVFDYLKGSTLYSVRHSDDVELEHVLDKYLLKQFIRDSQPDTWRKLENLFPADPMEAVADEFAKLRNKRGVLNLIREGFTLQGAKDKLRENKEDVVNKVEAIDSLNRIKGFLLDLKEQI